MAQCVHVLKGGNRCKNEAIEGHATCRISSHRVSDSWPYRTIHWIANHKIVQVEIALAVVALILGVLWHINEQSHAAYSGKLKPGDSVPITRLDLATAPIVSAAPGGVYLADGDESLLALDIKVVRWMWLFKRTQALVSATIRDINGNMMGKIENNVWQVQQSTAWDRNYSDTVLEVIDPKGNVAFQIVNLGTAFYFAGTLRCKDGSGIFWRPDFGKGAVLEPIKAGMAPDEKLTRLCKYPSQLYLGECEANRIPEMPARSHLITKPINICP
jgi:hypothetical protein